jgi:NAD(P)H-dependent flavin oxidoreductase YrpB (nitropropane dioxygenase family)
MRTRLAADFGIEVPIFAFSHCRDVVAAVTNAGGMGILGAAWMTAEEFAMSLDWIDAQVGGKPYGVDLVFPGTFEDVDGSEDLVSLLPQSHRAFVDRLLDDAGIPPLPEDQRGTFMREYAAKMAMTPAKSARQFEIALRHPVRFIVGALGVPPRPIIEAAHAKGIKVGALVGSAKHAARQREAGVDVLVAQGTEAGGSVGSIASMVLWPQVVEAFQPGPVLAAGGIARGSQILAALAMGAEGVWLGSIWLGTTESELTPQMKQRLFEAAAEDAVLSKALTGKQGRMLRSRYSEAWDAPGAPKPLTFPLQSILAGEPFRRAERGRRLDYWTYSVGQIVGDMRQEASVGQVMARLLNEYVDALERLRTVAGLEPEAS